MRIRSGTFTVVALCAMVAAVPAGQSLRGQTAPAAGDEFQRQVLPILTKTCVTCHNDRLQTAGFSFESFRDAATATQKPELWQKVLDKLNGGLMPPRPASPLSPAELSTL